MSTNWRALATAAIAATYLATTSYELEAAGKSGALMPKINKAVDADTKRLQEIFKDIHQNAELGFMETRTAAIVAKELKALGFEVKTDIGKTGVVGIL